MRWPRLLRRWPPGAKIDQVAGGVESRHRAAAGWGIVARPADIEPRIHGRRILGGETRDIHSRFERRILGAGRVVVKYEGRSAVAFPDTRYVERKNLSPPAGTLQDLSLPDAAAKYDVSSLRGNGPGSRQITVGRRIGDRGHEHHDKSGGPEQRGHTGFDTGYRHLGPRRFSGEGVSRSRCTRIRSARPQEAVLAAEHSGTGACRLRDRRW
jgi:hypothetical protein